jgi:gephyrin
MSSFPMISIADATAKVLEITQMLDPVSLPLSSLAGAILAEDVLAQESVPAVPTSIMDGYAVVSSDGPGEYKLCGHARAGDSSEEAVTPGTVAYITTGAPIPKGADAVVMIEDTTRSGDLVQIKTRATARQHIREIGSDMEKSQVILSHIIPRAHLQLFRLLRRHRFRFPLGQHSPTNHSVPTSHHDEIINRL